MGKKQLLFSGLLTLMSVSMAHAQKAYTCVRQNDVKIDKLGTAAFDVTSSPRVKFVDGKAVMTIGGNTVAKLPMSDGGQLVVGFTTTEAEENLNKVTKTCSNDFATLYSPFQLTVPEGSDVEVYAPTYDASAHELLCNSETKINQGNVIPAETALLLKNKGTIDFAISDGAPTVKPQSALSGSSLLIDKPEVASGNTLYTLGHETNDPTKYGFFEYTGTTLAAGLAWLVEPTFSEGSQAKYVHLNFGEETAIDSVDDDQQATGNGKYLENGRIIIVKNGQKFNLNGQEIK